MSGLVGELAVKRRLRMCPLEILNLVLSAWKG